MSDLERITGLINEIYDAALDASLWPRVLQHMMLLLHGASTAIASDAGRSNDRCRREAAVEPTFAESCARVLAPHFERAVAIIRALERSESKSAALGEVLERLSSAVVFVDRDGRLVHANAPATQMLTVNDVLGWSGGKPQPRDERPAPQPRPSSYHSRRGICHSACSRPRGFTRSPRPNRASSPCFSPAAPSAAPPRRSGSKRQR